MHHKRLICPIDPPRSNGRGSCGRTGADRRSKSPGACCPLCVRLCWNQEASCMGKIGDIAVRTGLFGFTKDQPKSCLESLEQLNACHRTRNAQFELNHSTAQIFNDRLQRLDPHAEPFILPEGQFSSKSICEPM